MSERAAALLEDAADYMESHGWCQHAVEDRHGRVCLLGAIGRALQKGKVGTCALPNWGLEPGTAETFRHLGGVIGCGNIPGWNDEPGRTQQEALDALRRAAKHARGVAN